MDVVVVLALAVLAVVFIVSLLILVVMCYRQKMVDESLKNSPQRFSKLAEIDNIEEIGQLNPLIGELLDKNTWVYDVSGLLQHCVAVLRLCHTLTDKLAAAPLNQAPPQLSEAICMATQRVMPRFDDLLCAVASPSVDVRVLEARATSLATVCWSLFLPFTLLHSKYKEMLSAPLNEMNQHLLTLRTAAMLAERTEQGKVPIDWKRIVSGGDTEDEDDEDEASSSLHPTHITETTPLVSSAAAYAEEDVEQTNIPSNDRIPSVVVTSVNGGVDSARGTPSKKAGAVNGGAVIGAPPSTKVIVNDDEDGDGSVSSNASNGSTAHPIDPKA